MDPLSIAASVIAVITASGTTLQGLERLWNLRHCNQEYKNLQIQVAGVRALLEATEIALRYSQICEQHALGIQTCLASIAAVIPQVKSTLTQFDNIIQDITTKNDHVVGKNLSRRSWLRRKSTLVQLVSQLRESTMLLSATLITLQGAGVLSTASQMALVTSMIPSNEEASSLKPLEVNTEHSVVLQTAEVIEIHQELGEADCDAEHPSLSRRSSCASFYSTLDIIESSKTAISISRRSYCASFDPALTSPDSFETPISLSHSTSNRTECNKHCSCRCHTITHSQIPWWITPFFGCLSIHGNGSRLFSRQACNKTFCRKSGTARMQFSYFGPTWTFLRAFNVYITAETVCGTKMSFNLISPRVIPSNATVWSIIELGKIEDLRGMLLRHETSPYDISIRGVSLLKYAAIKGQNDIYACLLAEKADPFFRDQTGMMAMQPGIDRALSKCNLDRNVSSTATSICELFENSDVIDQQGFSLLHRIVLDRNGLKLGFLLEDLDLDTSDNNGRTPLLWAAWRGDVAKVELLIQYGADLNKADKQSWTPLARAAKAGHLDVVRFLPKSKASWTISTSQGFQPIHHACDNKRYGAEIVEVLLAVGADPDVTSNNLSTPLHNAANRGSVETIKLLLACVSNIDAVDEDGDTPAMVALLCWNEPAFMYLAKAGARIDIPRRCGETVVHLAVWAASITVWDLLIGFAEAAILPEIDVSVLHDGHDISVCLEKCRALYYPQQRAPCAEEEVFGRMIQAFRR